MDTSTERKKVLVDTDAFVALYNAEDPNHAIARSVSASIVEENIYPLISVFSYGESITVISQKVGRDYALQYMKDIYEGAAFIIESNPVLLKKGQEVFKRQASKNVSFTDCVNIAIMEEQTIKEVFSFDKVYRKNGFKRLGID